MPTVQILKIIKENKGSVWLVVCQIREEFELTLSEHILNPLLFHYLKLQWPYFLPSPIQALINWISSIKQIEDVPIILLVSLSAMIYV